MNQFSAGICLALTLAIAPSATSTPPASSSGSVRDSRSRVRSATSIAVDELTTTFLDVLSETRDVAGALDAVLGDIPLLLRSGPTDALPDAEETTRQLQVLREHVANDPNPRVRANAVAFVDDCDRLLKIMPLVNEAMEMMRVTKVIMGDLPPRPEIYALLLGVPNDPDAPPRVAAGLFGTIAAPVALHVLVQARQSLDDAAAEYLAAYAAEGMRDSLRFVVAIVDSYRTPGVPPQLFPPDDRMDLVEEVRTHRERLQQLERLSLGA